MGFETYELGNSLIIKTSHHTWRLASQQLRKKQSPYVLYHINSRKNTNWHRQGKPGSRYTLTELMGCIRHHEHSFCGVKFDPAGKERPCSNDSKPT